MKCVIFDVDYTLVDWPDDYTIFIKKILNNFNIPITEDLPLKIYDAVGKYEETNMFFEKEKLVNFINKELSLNLPLTFADEYIKVLGDSAINNDVGLLDTIKYLSTKYDLFVLSNWFTESQEKRLEKLGILKYFKKIYGGDINYLKPNPKCFDIILKDYKKEECVYIGDNLKNDVMFPISMGIEAIWKTNENSKKYKTIKKISDLRNIL